MKKIVTTIFTLLMMLHVSSPAFAKGVVDATTTVVLTPEPCAQFVHNPDFGAINLFGKDLTKPITMDIKFTLTSCSSDVQTMRVTFVDHDHLPLEEESLYYSQCLLPDFSSGLITLKPGETRKFTMKSPSITPLPEGCYVQHIFSQTAIEANTDLVLNTDWQVMAVQSSF